MAYFPETIPPYKLKHLIEREAQKFRSYLAFGPAEPVDAFEVARLLGVEIVYPDDLVRLPPALRQLLLGKDRYRWSGVTFYLPGKGEYVLLNPTHSDRRIPATLMEEIAHVHLNHTPSVLQIDAASGLMARTYDRCQEREAYWFGSATLVPKCGLKDVYVQRYSIEDAARHYGVSTELIVFRTNLHGLRKYIAR